MENVSTVTTQDKTARRGHAQTKIAHTIPEAVEASGLSRSMLYIAIGRGALRARKCGARTVILDSDLREFLRSLPRFTSNEAILGTTTTATSASAQ
jgi:hypothetical protein